MLDDILTLFRRRRVPARRTGPARPQPMAINLATMGGPIYRRQRCECPRPNRRCEPRQPRSEPAREPRTDVRRAASPGRAGAAAAFDAAPPHRQRRASTRQAIGRAARLAAATRTAAGSGQDGVGCSASRQGSRHVAEHGNYLAAHAVEKSFGGRKVVKGASLYVRRGEAVGLLGPNGAGKTTVFYMITGLIKADRGRIELDGHDVTRAADVSARAARHRLSAAGSLDLPRPQCRGQYPRGAGGGRARTSSRREHELDALLEEFDITRLRKTPSIALSGGERRRVEIARALASRPNYMLLDEPFAGIDPIAVGDIQALVRHLTNRGIGVLITDHNVRETLASPTAPTSSIRARC